MTPLSKQEQHDRAVALVLKEYNCTEGDAKHFIEYLLGLMEWGAGEHHLTGSDYRAHHDIYEAIMPAHKPSRPGSAHEAIEQYLSGKDRIVTLKHTGTGPEGMRDCTTTVAIGTISA